MITGFAFAYAGTSSLCSIFANGKQQANETELRIASLRHQILEHQDRTFP